MISVNTQFFKLIEDGEWESFNSNESIDNSEKYRQNYFSQAMGKQKKKQEMNKYSSVNINDEIELNENFENYSKAIKRERNLSQRAFSILRMENESIANFFFGKTVSKSEQDQDSSNMSHPDIKSEISSGSNEIEQDDEEDDTDNQYRSNARDELNNYNFQNLLKNKNEDYSDDYQDNPLKDLLLSTEDHSERKERKNSKNISNMLKSGKKENDIQKEMFSSGNAQNIDIDKMLGLNINDDDLEKDSSNDTKGENDMDLDFWNKNRINIQNNHDLNKDYLDDDHDDDDDDLVNSGMGLDFDFLTKLDKEDDTEGNKITQDFISQRMANNFEKEMMESSDEKKKKNDDDFESILERIAKEGKCPEIQKEEMDDKNKESDCEEDIINRDIYIKQQDQYFVDDEEVYLNDLCTENYDWTYILDLFKVITHEDEEPIKKEDPNRDTIISYFQTICKSLLSAQPEDFLAFIYSNELVMNKLVENSNHIEIFAILKSVLNFRENTSEETSFRYLKHRFGYYRKVFNKLIDEGEFKYPNLANLFLDLVKESREIVDSNYFIEKILLDMTNQFKLIDLVIKQRGHICIEILSLIIKLNLGDNENKNKPNDGLIKDDSASKVNVDEPKKNALTQPHTPLDEEIYESKTTENLKRQSMDIVFNAYDPNSLKQNNFTNKILPKLKHLKNCIFGETNIVNTNEVIFSNESKHLKSISEFSQSQSEEQSKKEEKKIQTFGNGKDKVFAIGFDDIKDEQEETSKIVDKVPDDIKSSSSSDYFTECLKNNPFDQTYDINGAYDNICNESEDLYEVINSVKKFGISMHSSSSGYSKENFTLNLTPNKPKKSSIHMLNSSERKNYSDQKPKPLFNQQLDFSINSRPSFLDRKLSIKGDSNAFKEGDRNWDNLSVNTNEIISGNPFIDFQDIQKENLWEEYKNLLTNCSAFELMLFKELIFQKDPQELNVIFEPIKKYPFLIKNVLTCHKKELVEKRMNRIRKNSQIYEWTGEPSSKTTSKLINLMNSIVEMNLDSINKEIFKDNFFDKVCKFYKKFGCNTFVHISLTTLITNIIKHVCETQTSEENNLSVSQIENTSIKKIMTILYKDYFKWLSDLDKKQRNQYLFKGFLVKLGRFCKEYELKYKDCFSDSKNWDKIKKEFLDEEIAREDKVLVEDPKTKLDISDEIIFCPEKIQINTCFINNNLSKNQNFDSIENKEIMFDDDESDDEDSDDDESKGEYEMDFRNLNNIKNEDMFEQKFIEEDSENIYHSGFGKSIEIDENSKNKLFSKSDGDDAQHNLFEVVNDWNIYGQGSWKDLIPSSKTDRSNQDLDVQIKKTLSEDVPRHPINQNDNKKYGLFYTLTKRFKVNKSIKRVRPGKKIKH